MWKCKICGAAVAPNATAVLAHYEKKHFSTFLKNRDTIQRLPKAFIKEVTAGSKSDDPKKAKTEEVYPRYYSDPDRNRETNIKWLVDRIRDYTLFFEYREAVPFTCPCCNRTLSVGKRLRQDGKEQVDVCLDCFKAARRIIKGGK